MNNALRAIIPWIDAEIMEHNAQQQMHNYESSWPRLLLLLLLLCLFFFVVTISMLFRHSTDPRTWLPCIIGAISHDLHRAREGGREGRSAIPPHPSRSLPVPTSIAGPGIPCRYLPSFIATWPSSTASPTVLHTTDDFCQDASISRIAFHLRFPF